MGIGAGRVFLFLQGPHGPFFRHLATRLATTGAEVRCIAFNPADEAEWAGAGPFERYLGSGAAYPGWFAHHLKPTMSLILFSMATAGQNMPGRSG